ncbi:hypothetical protein RHSIM_Rhsim09G0041200 [Rhododendron simsii]|uniref:Uncharacterized protein n=1 Tax=Rhododendron simsii TaxID=118357 RepID=A0A834GEH7_RHOSS|nr:hypothetical protein RHSIM_Rhsim09G0041200 [Rhododendron simsii]
MSADEFYLEDAGYPNTRGFLAPYKGAPSKGPLEYGKRVGPWYATFPIGNTMETQRDLVTTTMAIHNFIRRSNMPNIPFCFYDRRPNFLPSDAGVETTAPNGQHGNVFVGDDQDMENVRASIRDWIVAHRIC